MSKTWDFVASVAFIVVMALMCIIFAVTFITYLWFVVLMVAAMGFWTLIPAVGIPIACIWAAFKVSK